MSGEYNEPLMTVTRREFNALHKLLQALHERMQKPGPQTEQKLKRQYEKALAVFDE